MIKRSDKLNQIKSGFDRSPIVSITGLRQSGKTTLAKDFASQYQGSCTHFDLEDPRSLARLSEPMTALENLSGLVVIDEVQRLPAIFPVLRVLADRKEKPACFLLLGSASPLLIKEISESLAGRVALLEMDGFNLLEVGSEESKILWNRGGLPPSFLAGSDTNSLQWRQDFMTLFVERDLPQFGVTFPSAAMRRFWAMLAHYHGQTWNASELAKSFDVSQAIIRKKLDILTGAYAIRQLPAWYENLGKRTVKSHKIYLRDSGLLHALLDLSTFDQLESHPKLGSSWEGFCIEQILSITGSSNAYFWATHAGAELDLFLLHNGKRIGVEIKYSDGPSTTRSMRQALEDLSLDHLYVVYPGKEDYPLDKNITVTSLPSLVSKLGDL
ncbi:ATP-binding protein [Opitutales bacterium]|nr:ATP-binding protein [Opitutales bacterium]